MACRLTQPGFTNPLITYGIRFANRADYGTNKPETRHWRIWQINTGTGSTVNVLYSPADCGPSSLPSSQDFNTRRCFPQNDNGTLSWWHKYVATDVYLGEHVGGGLFERWHYDYTTDWSSTGVLWRHDQDMHSAPAYRTWSRWAGYPTVITTHSEYDGAGPKQVTETLYYRGLNLDWTITGGANTKQVTLDDNWNHSLADDSSLAGQPARTLVWDGLINAARSNWTSATRHYYSVNETMRQPIQGPDLYFAANRVRETETFHQTVMAGPTYRETHTVTEYEPTYGLPTKVIDEGDTSDPADNRCVHTDYATANVAKWLVGLPKQTWTTTCAASPAAADVLAASRTTYDGLAYGAAPSFGLPTRTEAVKAVTAYPLIAGDFLETGRFTYDAHGRVRDSFDALNRQTTTSYSPATGGPVSQLTVTGPSINGQRWDTVTTLEPKYGVPTRVVDVNGRQTNAEYDAVGRLVKVWKDNRSTTATPDVQYTYYTGAPTAVSTKALGPDGQQIESFQINDGRMRPRQTQTVSGTGTGRVVADTIYSGIGTVAKSSSYFQTAAPSTTLAGADDKDIKVQQQFVYDNLGRTTSAEQWTGDGTSSSRMWQTVTGYDGDKTVMVTPPTGGTATTTIVNARGKTVELRQHTGATPATAVYATTSYAYDRLDQLKQVTDTTGNIWTYSYDLLGRKTQTVDPDAGTSTTVYDNAGQITSTVDGRLQSLFYKYDNLGRKTELRQDTATGLLRASWTYDTAVFHGTTTPVKGRLASATRKDGSLDYIQAVGSYDDGYRPRTTTVTAPGFGTGGTTLAYTVQTDYKVNGAVLTSKLPAVGGLPAEDLTHTYHTATGLPNRLTTTQAQNTYLDSQTYTYDGLPAVQLLGVAGKQVRQSNVYVAASRRLSNTEIETETTTPGTFTDKLLTDYTYDNAGNILTIGGFTNGVRDQIECFRYDQLRRLTEAWTQPAFGTGCLTPQRTGADPYWRQWTFDSIGNRLTQIDKNPTTGDTTWTYTIGGAGYKPHQVKTITTTGTGAAPVRNFGYDNAGNTTTRTTDTGATQTLTWDKENHLATLTQGSDVTSYLYDPEGRRLISASTGSTTKKTLYLPDGTELEKIGTADPLATRYHAGVAVRDTAGLRWTIADHHGTSTAQIDPATLTVNRRRSLPYGEDRTTTPTGWKGTKTFVGGTKDPTGLTHLGAREYDPTTGRFISVDPIMDLADPQQWNAYNYGNNSPVTYSDPNGLKSKDEEEERYENAPPLPPQGGCIGNMGSASCNEGGGGGPVITILGNHIILAPSEDELKAALDGSWQATTHKLEDLGCMPSDMNAAGPCNYSTSYYWQGNALCGAHPDWCTYYHENTYRPEQYNGAGGVVWQLQEVNGGVVAVSALGVVVLWKAPQKGQMSGGQFNPDDYPGGPGKIPDGNAYFGKGEGGREVAEEYEKSYRNGLVKVEIPEEDYDRLFSRYEHKYQGGPRIEVVIPRSQVATLNAYLIEWRQNTWY